MSLTILKKYAEIPAKELNDWLWEGTEKHSPKELLLMCDALWQRKSPVRYLKVAAEEIAKAIPDSESAGLIDLQDALAPNTLLVLTKARRANGFETVHWFYLGEDLASNGPHTRADIVALLEAKTLNANNHVLQEGDDEWKPISNWPSLISPYYKEQVFEERPKEYHYEKQEREKAQAEAEAARARAEAEKKKDKKANSGQSNKKPATDKKSRLKWVPTFAATVQFIQFPFWGALIIFATKSGFESVTGAMFPFVYCGFMLVVSIPLGLGLANKKKWAYSLKISTGVVTAVWFGIKYFLDGASLIWPIMGAFEIAVVLCVMFAHKVFEAPLYGRRQQA